MKIILSENQLRLLTEALGVPDNILEAADKLYDIVLKNLKKLIQLKTNIIFMVDLFLFLETRKKLF